MKTTMKTMAILIAIGTLSSCGFKRYGDFMMLANGNVDSKTEYQKLKVNAEAVVKTKKIDPLEECVDQAVKSVEGGEFLKNVTVYVKKSGRKIKVTGDVYGIPVDKK
jgi:outer membrane lipopolysaccharide assembly protein LptE/RlpB